MTSTASSLAQITLNGESRDVPDGSFVSDLVSALALDPRRVAIELNRSIIPRSAYHSTTLMAGDQIEIVGFIGGG
jgi:sulfur carrier protein